MKRVYTTGTFVVAKDFDREFVVAGPDCLGNDRVRDSVRAPSALAAIKAYLRQVRPKHARPKVVYAELVLRRACNGDPYVWVYDVDWMEFFK